MGTMIRITGSIGRPQADPAAPIDPTRAFLGMLEASWTYDGPRGASAAILKIATGGGVTDGWGPNVLCLRWIGDPPPLDIARAVYDAVRDRGDSPRVIALQVEATGDAAEFGTYRSVRAAAVR